MSLRRFSPVVVSSLLALFMLAPDVAAQRAQSRAKTRKPKPAAGATEPNVSRYVEEGLRHADEGKWAEAIKSYRHALVDNPQDVEAYLHMGDAYLNAGNDKEAVTAYQQAVRLAPRNADAQCALGTAYNVIGRNSDAFKPLVQAISLAPDYAEAYYGIGYAYERLDNFKEAVGYLKSAVRLKPNYSEAHLSLGLAYVGLGELTAAEAQLNVLQPLDASMAQELKRELSKALVAVRPLAPDTTAARRPSEPATRRDPDKRTPGGATPTQPGQTAAPASPLDVELSFWDSIKNSTDPEEYAAYLHKYPAGQFADLARIRLRTLGGKKSNEPVTPQQPAATASPATEPSLPPVQPQPVLVATPTPTPESRPAPPVERPAEPETPATLAEALNWIKRYFPTKFSYQTTTPGESTDAAPVTNETQVDYEPLRFQGCTVEWRDQRDTMTVSLAELDPSSVKIELRQRPSTTFSPEVWQVSITATGGTGAFRELKGDGSGSEVRYNGVDLQHNDREVANKLARALQSAIKFCGGKPAPA